MKRKQRIFMSLAMVALLLVGNRYAQAAPPEAPTGEAMLKTFDKLSEASCIACHDGSDANGFDASQLTDDLSDRANFDVWQKVHDQIASGAMPPAEADRPDAELTKQAVNAIHDTLTRENLSNQTRFGRTVLRRLTRSELQHTLNDLLSIEIDLSEVLPPENNSSQFDTVAEKQGLSEIHVRAYLTAADAAIEQAIELRPKPESKKREFRFTELEAIKKHLAKEQQNQERVILRELDDAVVMFNTASYLFKLEDLYVADDGRYRISATGASFQADEPVTMTINIGHYEKGYTRGIAQFDLPQKSKRNRRKKSGKSSSKKKSEDPASSELGKSRTVSVEAFLRKGNYIFPGGMGLKLQADGKTVWNVSPEEYTGSGIAMESMTVEGPLYENWPPRSTRLLLQGVETRPFERKQWDPSRQTFIGYEIVAGDNPEAQLRKIIKWLAPRAFRRSLRDGEGQPFLEMGMAALESGRSFDEAIRLTCKSILTSPEFLFLTPAPGELNQFSLAARLSLFLWKSVPDEELYAVAGKGKLNDPTVLRRQVNRMLDDDRAKRFVTDFCQQWLRLSEIDATSPDKSLYPEFDALLRSSMIEETESFVSHLFEKDLGVANLVDSKFAFLNRRLADHYQINGVKGQRIKRIRLHSDSVRGGLLTQASILKVTANGTTTSPVRRGAWVLTHLLGQPPSPPPPNIPAVEPDTRNAETIRQLLDKHRSDPSCARCHREIDAPGFALESFDVIGGFRENYRSREIGEQPKGKLLGRNIWEYKIGPPVDASGVLAANESSSGGSFSDIRQFKQLLLEQEEQIARNLISQLAVYGTGAEIQFADREEIERILAACKKKDYGMRTILHKVIASRLFLNK